MFTPAKTKSKLKKLEERLVKEIEEKELPPKLYYGPNEMAISYKEPERKGPILTMGLKRKLTQSK